MGSGTFFMPNRILRDWTDSERVDQLDESSEVVFIRLIMKADDHGCFTGNLKLLKASLFPLRDTTEIHIDRCLNLLAESGLVNRYKIEGKSYVQINDFGQRLRTMNSKFPLPDSNSRSNDRQVSDIRPPETKRNEVETSEKEKGKTLTLGSGKNFFSVTTKYATDKAYIVKGVDGLKEYMELNKSILDFPDQHERFMREVNGDVFNEFMHVKNRFKKFIEKQYA